MKVLKNILVLLLGMIFIISSSGYVLYSSSCSCTGEEQTSVFVKPETCETSFHQHHNHDLLGNETICSEEECHDCQDHTKSCGCDSPKVFFFKLKDQVINEDIKFVVPELLQVDIWLTESLEALLTTKKITEPQKSGFCDAPPLTYSSLDFLVRIQQLKIPSIA